MAAPDPSNTIIIIPARMASARLPGKPLADICGEPMIVHVWRRAVEAGIGPVLVAVAEAEIADCITAAGGEAVLTDPDLPSGSDRIAQALTLRDPDARFQYVINLQGDLPLIDPVAINLCLQALSESGADISTLAAAITGDDEVASTNVVKVIAEFSGDSSVAVASDFARQLPHPATGSFWHHIGIYGYTRAALERFVVLPISKRERDRKLEQMRAMDNAMTIVVARVDTIPFGVDTPADLARARREIGQIASS